MAYNRFRTCTPEADWRSFRTEVPSGSTYEIGQLQLVNDTWGQVLSSQDNSQGNEPVGTSIVAGKAVAFVYNAEKILVEKADGTGLVINEGDKVYVDHTTREVYNTNAANRTCIGICTEPATWDDDLVEIDLKGDSMTDQA